MGKKTAVPLILLLICLYHCTGPEKLGKTRPDPYWNDLALFLAGMPQRADSAFREAAANVQYAHHVEAMNAFWDMVRTENIDHIVPWRTAYVDGGGRARTAFYPFSGADLANLYTFFPGARTYVMVALENPGPIPDPLALAPGELSQGLSAIHRVTGSIASRNYFHSAVMQKELPNHYLPGTLPVLLIFAARLGLCVGSVELIGIDDSGTIAPLDAKGSIGGTEPSTRGARITFTAPHDTHARTIIYLDLRLSDRVLEPSTPEGKFFRRMGGFDTLIKSAVYLLHRRGFSGLCDFILARSGTLIQDDSGIPYRLFDKKNWDLRLFGTYTRPRKLKDLENPPDQPDLALAFSEKSGPLPFGFGYGVLTGRDKSNLLVAVRKKDR